LILDTYNIESLLFKWYKSLKQEEMPLIDLSPYSYIDLGALSLILVFVYTTVENRWNDTLKVVKNFPIRLPHESSNAFNFLINSGFIQITTKDEAFIGANEINNKYKPKQRKRLLNFRLLEYKKHKKIIFNTHREQFIYEHKKLIYSFNKIFFEFLENETSYEKEDINEIITSFYELHHNIYSHSQSWGYTTACLTKSGLIICISDLGLGIKHTLGHKKVEFADYIGKNWDDHDAIKVAVRLHTTGKNEVGGMGLYRVKQITQNYHGVLEIRSFKGKVVYDYRPKPKPRSWEARKLIPIPGVQIKIWLPIKEIDYLN